VVRRQALVPSSLHGFLDCLHLIGSIRLAFEPDRRTALTKSKVIHPCGTLGEDGEIRHFETVGIDTGVWTKPPDGWRISERTWIHGWIWGDYPLAHGPGEF